MSGAQPRHRLHVPSGLRFLPRPSLHASTAAGEASAGAARPVTADLQEHHAGERSGLTAAAPAEGDELQPTFPDVPPDLRWSCTLTDIVLKTDARASKPWTPLRARPNACSADPPAVRAVASRPDGFTETGHRSHISQPTRAVRHAHTACSHSREPPVTR